MNKRRDNGLTVGSRVSLTFGAREVIGTVVRDRGNVGMGGRRMLLVRLDWEQPPRLDWEEAPEPIELEMPEAELRRAAA